LQNHKQNELEQKARSSARDQKRSDHKEYYRQGMWLNSGWGVAAMHGTQPTKYYNQCIADSTHKHAYRSTMSICLLLHPRDQSNSSN